MGDWTSILIFLGVFGLLYLGAVAALLFSCGRLHRLEGAKAWRVAWYSILVELSLVFLSTLGAAATIYCIVQLGRELPEWIEVLETWINHASGLAHTIALGSLTLALAYPLRKTKAGSGGSETNLPDVD